MGHPNFSVYRQIWSQMLIQAVQIQVHALGVWMQGVRHELRIYLHPTSSALQPEGQLETHSGTHTSLHNSIDDGQLSGSKQ